MTLPVRLLSCIRSALLLAASVMAVTAFGEDRPGSLVPLVDSMPARPEIWRVIDWNKRAVAFDQLAFDENALGTHLPLLTWGEGAKTRFMIPSYVGSGKGGEAICALAAVMSGSLIGVDKTNDRGRNWARLSEAWFSERSRVVMNNAGARNQGGSFWYLVLPGVLYSQLAVRYPDVEGMGEKLREMADRYREVVETLGGANADFNHTGFDFEKNAPSDNGHWTEPDAAAGIAYIEYAAWTRWHDPRHLEAARWCLDFLDRRKLDEGNPLYETLLYYAPALAAKFNAEHGTHYDVAKLVNWCLSDNNEQGSARPHWGILARKFGASEAYGLQGFTREGEGYAFAMNTFNAAAALAPLARYDERFAAPLAKWLTHLTNNARLFFPDEMPAAKQSCPQLRDTVLNAVPYEGLREKAKVQPEWKLETVEVGTGEAEADSRLHRGEHQEAKFQCDREGRLAILIAMQVPASCDGGRWHIEARIACANALFHVKSAATREGPWQNCGGFTGRTPHTDGNLAAGGPLNGVDDKHTIWIKIDAAGRHDAGEPLIIRSLRFFASLRTSPWASGDSFTDGHGPTDLAPYGGAYIGYLAALVRRTGHEHVLAFNLSATDFLSTDRTPVWLCYNADTESRTVALAPAEPVLVPTAAAVIIRTARTQ